MTTRRGSTVTVRDRTMIELPGIDGPRHRSVGNRPAPVTERVR